MNGQLVLTREKDEDITIWGLIHVDLGVDMKDGGENEMRRRFQRCEQFLLEHQRKFRKQHWNKKRAKFVQKGKKKLL